MVPVFTGVLIGVDVVGGIGSSNNVMVGLGSISNYICNLIYI